MSTPTSPIKAARFGAGAGMVAALAMAMYAMVAEWIKGDGFFTPLYHIASLWTSGDSMTSSMHDAMAGTAFHFVLGTALVGAVIHMMTGAMYGALFGFAVAGANLKPVALVGLGLAYGALVFAFSAWIALPLGATLFGSGDAVTHMASMAGWSTFFVEHLVFGVVLAGGLVARRARALA